MKRAASIVCLCLVALAGTAAAQPGATPNPGATLTAAEDALGRADYDRVLALAGQVAAAAPDKADLAEAHRLLGLAHFFRHEDAAAEADFLAYLQLDLDGRLDPSTTPPEAIAFFEDVRARHAADLRKLRPRPRRWRLLNLIPPGGQIQNGEITKAWVIGGAEIVLAAADLTTYFLLRSWCSPNDFTCTRGGNDVTGLARKLRVANYVAGAALIGVYLYGVLDGMHGYARAREAPVVGIVPTDGGVVVGAAMSF